MYRPCFRNVSLLIAITVAFTAMGSSQALADDKNADRIKPYLKNPRYWQYKGEPVMLLGGSKDDSLFQIPNLKEHLDELRATGGNYIRNTMSDRLDQGFEIRAFRKLPSGQYDLNQWNDEYWQRFENMLKWTAERDIIVQIEVWDRFDYTDNRKADRWKISPWNPANNINYTHEQTGLLETYKDHPGRDKQPFFHTVRGSNHYQKKLDPVRIRQEAFVAKMLSYSLKRGNVLYCMNNETSTDPRWGQHWIEFIQTMAAKKGVTVCTTDMFDDAFEGEKAKHTPLIFSDPEHYMFADISQVNSRNYDQTHWDRLQWLLQQVDKHPRPSNHTKIYGSGYYTFGTGGPEDGVERFWRNILGGSASARFHRPDAGNGLNDFAKGSIKAARLLESRVKFWEITPQMKLLSKRESNEAYLAAKPGERYALYFPNGGSVELDLSAAAGTFEVTWISISQGMTTQSSATGGYRLTDKTIKGGGVVTMSAPYKGGWVAAIVKK